jgi:hypothetical protein
MQTARILQAVVLMLIVALAASCATGNQYISKVFKPRTVADSMQTVKVQKQVKFLEFDSTDDETLEWVKKDPVKDSSADTKTIPIIAETKSTPVTDQPVAKTTSGPGGVRTKTKRE